MPSNKFNSSGKRGQPVCLSDGRIVGVLEGDTFHKYVKPSHMLKKPPAWAIDADVFDEQVKPVAGWIVIWERESGTQYKTSVASFEKWMGELDRGYGRQYFLPLPRWEVVKADDSGSHQLEFPLQESSDLVN